MFTEILIPPEYGLCGSQILFEFGKQFRPVHLVPSQPAAEGLKGHEFLFVTNAFTISGRQKRMVVAQRAEHRDIVSGQQFSQMCQTAAGVGKGFAGIHQPAAMANKIFFRDQQATDLTGHVIVEKPRQMIFDPKILRRETHQFFGEKRTQFPKAQITYTGLVQHSPVGMKHVLYVSRRRLVNPDMDMDFHELNPAS